MTLIENLNRARELAGMEPLSEVQKTTILTEAAAIDHDAIIDKVWVAVQKWEHEHETTHDKNPAKSDVAKWWKQFYKDNKALNVQNDPLDEMVDGFYESFTN